MKALKVLILLLGIAGLASLFVPIEGASMFSLFMEGPKVDLVILLAGFGVPTLMGVMGLAKPPFLAWQAVAALAGFALIFIKTHGWEMLPHIMDLPILFKLFFGVPVAGMLVSAIAVAKPESQY